MAPAVNLPVLSTPRLRLVPATAEDVDPLHALLQLPTVRRYLCDDITFSPGQVAARLAASVSNWPAGLGHWSIRDRANAYLGFVELQPVSPDIVAAAPRLAGETEPMIAVAPAAWGAGYATEALRAALAHAFGAAGLPRLVALVDEPNADSHRLMSRVGFAAEGRCAGAVHPLRVYGLARGAWLGDPSALDFRRGA